MASNYFEDSEIGCHCGRHENGEADTAGLVSGRLLELLDQLRENIGGPLTLSCAYRCPEHNAEVGGVPNSQHVDGTAADVQRPNFLTMGEFLWHVQQLPFDGIGVYHADAGDFIHVDVRDGGVSGGYSWEEGSAESD